MLKYACKFYTTCIHTGASDKCAIFSVSFRHSWTGGVWGNEGAVHALRRRIPTGVCTKRPGQVIQRDVGCGDDDKMKIYLLEQGSRTSFKQEQLFYSIRGETSCRCCMNVLANSLSVNG